MHAETAHDRDAQARDASHEYPWVESRFPSVGQKVTCWGVVYGPCMHAVGCALRIWLEAAQAFVVVTCVSGPTTVQSVRVPHASVGHKDWGWWRRGRAGERAGARACCVRETSNTTTYVYYNSSSWLEYLRERGFIF